MAETGSAIRLRESVAEEIRVLMVRRRVRSLDLAEALGKSQAYVSRRLGGGTAFDVDDMEVIAAKLGVRVVDLLPQRHREVTAGYRLDLGPYDPTPATPPQRVASTPVPMLAAAIATPLPGGPPIPPPGGLAPPPGRRRTAPVPAGYLTGQRITT